MPASDRANPSVWTRPRRKERSILTRDHIVGQALQLLDTEGIEALSMRKLAARLTTTAAALYWHVANRDELLELVLDQVFGEIETPDDPGADAWQADARRFAHSMRAAAVRHPWVVSVLDRIVAGYPGPNLSAASERMLGVFEAAGFEIPEADRALNTLSAYVTGMVMSEAAWHNWLARQGQTQQEWAKEAQRVAEELADDHERIRAAVASYEGKDPQQAMDEDFDYGLDRVLDGLQARLDQLS